METRKVQRTGKSTFVVSLPKSWATKKSIKPGSIIYINQNNNGDLMLSVDRSQHDMKIKLDIKDKSGEPLIRDIIACYVAGYRTIEITSQHMSQAQKRDLHNIVHKLIGPEVLEETINKMVIQDLIDSEELQVDKALKRIKNIVKSMIQDSISALIDNNREVASDVVERDDEVDRLNLLISRQFTEILRSNSIRQERLNVITAFTYMQAASNLERIADHASKIAKVIGQCDCARMEEMIKEFSWLEPVLNNLIEDSLSYLLQADSDKANELIDKTREVKLRSESLAGFSSLKVREEMLVRLVVTRSVERMLDYIMNIGELTINLCNAQIDVEVEQ